MTEEQRRNEVVLREMFTAFERGEYDRADTFLTPDNQVLGSTTSQFQIGTSTTMTERAKALDEAFPQWRVTLREVVAAPDGSSLVGIMATSLQREGSSGFGALTGAVYLFRDGRICEVHAFQSTDAALLWAGLKPRDVTFRPHDPR